MKGPIL